MKLEWFRQHKKFVYWILLPVVGGGMAFFGATSFLYRANELTRPAGPGIVYKVGDVEKSISPSEVITLRTILTLYQRRGGQVTTDQAAVHVVEYATALADGFELGTEEMKERLKQTVREQIQVRDDSFEGDPDQEAYHKLLQSMQLTAHQFEQLTHDLGVISKYVGNVAVQAKVSDPELFVAYCKDKETARLRYLTVKSEAFLDKTTAPDDKKVEEFYNEHKDLKTEKDEKGKPRKPDTEDKQIEAILYSQPKLSAELLYFDPAKVLADLKPTAEDLQKYYDIHKSTFWKEEPPKNEAKKDEPKKEGEAQPEPKYKPFESVKAEVKEKWQADEKKTRPRQKANSLNGDLRKAEEAFNTAEAQKPAADRKPFDVAKWAKEHDLTYWTTPEQTEDKYAAGKKDPGTADSVFVENQIFKQINPDAKDQLDRLKKDFHYPEWVDSEKPERGLVMARLKTWVEPQLKPLADAKPAIVERLREEEAVELARKETNRIHDEWKDGKNPPDVDKLDEIVVDEKSTQPLASTFFAAPVGVGEVMDVASADADAEAKPEKRSENQVFYIGFPVERKLPTLKTFAEDTQWKREDERKKAQQSTFYSMYLAQDQEVKDAAKAVGNVPEPQLFDQYRGRRGGKQTLPSDED